MRSLVKEFFVISGSLLLLFNLPAKSETLPEEKEKECVCEPSDAVRRCKLKITYNQGKICSFQYNNLKDNGEANGKSTTKFVDHFVVGNSLKLDVRPLSDTEAYFLGKQLGSTDVIVYSSDNKYKAILEFEIVAPVDAIQKAIEELAPSAKVVVSTLNGRLILSGEVSDKATADRIEVIARKFLPVAVNDGPQTGQPQGSQNQSASQTSSTSTVSSPTSEAQLQNLGSNGQAYDPIINAITIRDSQQVLLEVRFLSVSRSIGKELGVNWASRGQNDFIGSGAVPGPKGQNTVNRTIKTSSSSTNNNSTTTNVSGNNASNTNNSTTNNSSNTSSSANASNINSNTSNNNASNSYNSLTTTTTPPGTSVNTITENNGFGSSTNADTSSVLSSNSGTTSNSGTNSTAGSVLNSILGSNTTSTSSSNSSSNSNSGPSLVEAFPLATSAPVLNAFALGATALGVPYATVLANVISGSTNVDVAIRALEQRELVRRLAEPNLIALSGQKASFLAGGSIPYNTASTTGSGNAVLGQTVFVDYGVKLDFKPTILPNGVINISLIPEVSEPDLTFNTGAGPSIIKRKADTVVELRDGQTFIVAGLLDGSNRRAVAQVPWIGSLPVIGALFRDSGFQKFETELVILVTPRIIKPLAPYETVASPLDQMRSSSDRELFFGRGELEVTANQLANKREGTAEVAPARGHMIDATEWENVER